MQSRRQSLIETCISIGIGFCLALLTQFCISRLWGFPLHLMDNIAITCIFTVVSFIRQYFVRRLFNYWHHRS